MQCKKTKLKIKFARELKSGNKLYKVYGCGAIAEYKIVCNEKNICKALLAHVPVPVEAYREEKTDITSIPVKKREKQPDSRPVIRKKQITHKQQPKSDVLDEEEAPL